MDDRASQTAVEKLAGTFKADTVKLILCKVKSVDEAKATCEVTGQGDVVIPNVLLQSAICDGLLVLPKVGSDVYVLTSKYNQPLIVQYSDVEKYYLQVGEAELTLKSDGSVKISTKKTVDIASGDNIISLDDAGVNIDSNGKPVTIGGSYQVLYSKVPGANEIVDVSQIGVSQIIKVG